jgi:hypothetical protein
MKHRLSDADVGERILKWGRHELRGTGSNAASMGMVEALTMLRHASHSGSKSAVKLLRQFNTNFRSNPELTAAQRQIKKAAYLAQRERNARDDVRRLLNQKTAPRGVEILNVPPRKNPSRRDALERADRLLESFSGSRANKELRVSQRPIRTGLVVGPMLGVMYEADRGDGKANYFHRFKKSARPLLIADNDGSQLGIVGGRFRFTDRGIEDK